MENKYPHLFSPYTIKNVTFRNRIIAGPNMSGWPTREGASDINCLYDYIARAKGGAAVVTQGETTINRTDAVRGYAVFLTQEEHLQGTVLTPMHLHGKLVEAVNRHGALACIQLYHAGETASPKFAKDGIMGPITRTREDGAQVRGMDEADMEKVCADFENAAHIARLCGYQIMQIHAGHGWLLSQFLSPMTNKRTDEYGGSLENRAKFPIRIIEAVRRGAGPGALISIRISGEEHVEGGMHIDEVAEFVKMVEDKIDLVHISAGCFYSSPQYTFPSPFQEHGLNVDAAAYVKQRVNIPVAVVGGLSDPAQMEDIIASGKADFVVVTRQFFADAALPRKAYEGHEDDIRPCLRCSNCLGLKGASSHHGCDVNPLVANGSFMLNSIEPVQGKRRVLIAGGGPAGMEAAITACDRGHEVILVDKAPALGGTLRHDDHVDFKADLKRFKDYLVRQVEKRDIEVRLNTEVTAELVDEIAPDYAIAAVGASPIVPNFEGADKLLHMNALEAHSRMDEIGKRVVVIGGGLVGCETAIHLAREGHEVTIVEMLDSIARDANAFYLSAIHEQVGLSGIEVRVSSRCEGFEEGGVLVANDEGTELIECDAAIVSVGMRSNREVPNMLLEKMGWTRFRDIGDCVTPKQMRQAVHQGYFSAMDIV